MVTFRDIGQYNSPYPDMQNHHPVEQDAHINLAIVGHVDSGKSTLVGISFNQANFFIKLNRLIKKLWEKMKKNQIF